eukprot:3774514-Rhodomonas_salina.1
MRAKRLRERIGGPQTKALPGLLAPPCGSNGRRLTLQTEHRASAQCKHEAGGKETRVRKELTVRLERLGIFHDHPLEDQAHILRRHLILRLDFCLEIRDSVRCVSSHAERGAGHELDGDGTAWYQSDWILTTKRLQVSDNRVGPMTLVSVSCKPSSLCHIPPAPSVEGREPPLPCCDALNLGFALRQTERVDRNGGLGGSEVDRACSHGSIVSARFTSHDLSLHQIRHSQCCSGLCRERTEAEERLVHVDCIGHHFSTASADTREQSQL